MYNSKKELFWIIVTAAIIVAVINLCSCSTTWKPEHEAHWPGYIVEPHALIFGPHDIQLRNAYSDGFVDGIKAGGVE